eukprot:393875_1
MSDLSVFTLAICVTAMMVTECYGDGIQVQNKLGNGIQQIIYNFDETISSEHIFHILSHIGGPSVLEQLRALDNTTEGTLIRMFGGTHRLDALKNHFETLTSRGIEFSIVSMGYKRVMLKALERVGLSKYFDKHNVYGRHAMHPDAIKYYMEHSTLSDLKVVFMIIELKKLRSGQKVTPEHRLLVDNNPLTLEQAETRHMARVLDSEIVNGMTETQMEAIESMT